MRHVQLISLSAVLQRLRQSKFILLALALLLAAGLRLWWLEALPPGLYHDEAYNGLDARRLLDGGTFPYFHEGWELYRVDAYATRAPRETRWPVFFEGNYGREPLHVYLMALSIALFGQSPFAIRLVPALAGIAAVWATYLAAASLLPRRWQPGAAPGAAFALAVFFPAVHYSRFGIRGMLFLPVASLCVYGFWRGVAALEDGNRRAPAWLAFAGLWLGLSLYTYSVARLFPLVFLLFVPLWLGWSRERWRRALGPLAAMAGTSLVVAAPLLLFFARYPFYFTFRAGFVANRGSGAVNSSPWLTWLLNVGRVVRGLFWQGDAFLRHNLPGRPFLDPLQGVLTTGGVAAAVVTGWRRPAGEERARWLFLGLWVLVMLLPSIFSGDAPHFGRMIGVAPPLAIVAGAGVEGVRRLLQAQRGVSSRAASIVVAALLTISAALTARDYFGRYAAHPELAAAFYVAEWELGRYAAGLAVSNDLYLTPTQEEMATIYFALEDADLLHSFARSGAALPMGRPGRAPLYLVRPDEPAQVEALEARLPGAVVEPAVAGAVPVRVETPLPAGATVATWEGAVALSDWELAREADHLTVTLRWQALANMQRDYTVYVHLVDDEGNLVAQEDRPPDGYPTSDWRLQEWVEDRFQVALPGTLPAGSYHLRTGFYYLPTAEPLGAPVALGEPFTLP
jgi:4-amino-4-deoxy-L-arabinose transferase-like glycosyltransferase